MTSAEILQAVRTALKALFGLPDAQVLPADSDAVRPVVGYLTVRVLSGGTGQVETLFVRNATDVPTTRVVERDKDARISINAYGNEAVVWLDRLRTLWMSQHSAIEAMRETGLHPSGASEPRNLTAIRDTGPEPRLQLDLEAYHHVVLDDDQPLDVIDQITVDLTMTPGPDVSATLEV